MNAVPKRLIARLDIKGDNVVRGIHLEGLRVVGQPEDMAARYCSDGADELIFVDTVASLYGRNNTLSVVERTAQFAFLPLTVGGGIRSLSDVEAVLAAGADKVTLNSAAVARPELITEIAEAFGSQCVVAAVEAKSRPQGGWTPLTENAREPTGLDAIEWAKEMCDRGCGELLLTSIDKDGTRTGPDAALISAVAAVCPVPLIAAGGFSTTEHVKTAYDAGADAVALGTILHFGLVDLSTIRAELATVGCVVRDIGPQEQPWG